MNDYFKKNLNILNEKNSHLAEMLMDINISTTFQIAQEVEKTLVVDGIHLNSCFDSEREATVQTQLIPTESTVAHVYGLSNGSLQQRLLKRSTLKYLHVHLMNLNVSKAVFTHFDHSVWLDDARTSIDFSCQEEIFIPFTAIHPCILLADSSLNRLKDRLILELNSPFNNWMMQNEIVNWQERLQTNESIFKTDGDVAELFNTIQDQTTVVAGGGPTLSDHFDWLRKNRKDIKLIAVNTPLKSLVSENIIPDVVIVIDPRDFIDRYFDMDLSLLENTSLVYFPGVLNNIISNWPGKRFGAYPDNLSEILKLFEKKIPKSSLFSAGSVIHPATDLAVKMGANKVMFLGADFSFPKGKTHVTGSALAKIVEEEKSPEHCVLNMKNEKVPSRPDLIGFLRDLEGYIQNHPEVQFINGSREGAVIHGTIPIHEV